MTGHALPSYDVVVVGAGIVGLAVALESVERGARVAVVERDAFAVGASVRNFGHIGTTVQAGRRRDYALVARERWLRLAADGVVDARECGTLVVARAADELAVLLELNDELGDDEVCLLPRAEVTARVGTSADVLGGALLPRDLCVDPRTSVARIADRLAGLGVDFHWATLVQRIEDDRVVTNRGALRADRIVVAVGHDVDTLYPEVAEAAGVLRCALAMQAVAHPSGGPFDSAVLTGYSMLRYPAFADCPSLVEVRERLTRTEPEAIEADLNLMLTALPDGRLVLGDTHHLHTTTVPPFPLESDHRLIDRLGAQLFGVASLDVLERWQGVYAWADAPYLAARPAEHVTVLSVTTGVGMTTAFGFVADALAHDRLPLSA